MTDKAQYSTSRFGLHYFQDTDHYTTADLADWLPEMTRLSVKWVVLRADSTRAIPEHFIKGVTEAGITPIVHLPLSLPHAPSDNDLRAILQAYANWGVKYIVLFEKPNSIQSWSTSGWSQQNLVERFIDRFAPLAVAVLQLGMTPVFPPLEPGGNYWDLIFLKQALKSLQRRGNTDLLKKMVLSAYAYTYYHELDWGAGGPEKWTDNQPYRIVNDGQNQVGFNNFQWVQNISQTVLQKETPIFMFGAGVKDAKKGYAPEIHAEIVLSILDRLEKRTNANDIPDSVQACCFSLLAAEPGTDEYVQAWYKSTGDCLPIVRILAPEEKSPAKIDHAAPQYEHAASINPAIESAPIAHYLLLPIYEWGIADWHLEVIRPFIRKYAPTVGFSKEEAFSAQRVTIVGGSESFPDNFIDQLRSNGILVDQITGDGTSIATQLAER